jgi:hypothetical protein
VKAGVYFFLRSYKKPEDAGYQHRSIALAEGLRALGIPVFANIDYWRLGEDSSMTLFCREPSLRPEDCDVLVAEHVYFEAEKKLPPQFIKSSRRYRTVFIDAADGWRTPSMAFYKHGCDIVLRCHFNARFEYGGNVRPWAFGLSERILNAVQGTAAPERRRRALLCNYRALHPVRKYAHERFIPLIRNVLEIDTRIDDSPPPRPYDRLMWEQSGRRHDPGYYERLAGNLACSAFGGYFVPSFSRSLDSLPLRAANKAVARLGISTSTIAQFDSWRFWESLAAGCAVFHVDLDHYGCRLPVMPSNGIHYIGVDLDHPAQTAARIVDGSLHLEECSREGQRWAVENYSPIPVAKRFLEYVRAPG